MKQLISYIEEGLLKGQAKTLKLGDDVIKAAEKELAMMRGRTNANATIWKVYCRERKIGWTGKEYRWSWDNAEVKNLITVLGYDDSLRWLEIKATQESIDDDWVVDVCFTNTDYTGDTWLKTSKTIKLSDAKTFKMLLKKFINPIFEDFDSLAKYFEENGVN